MSQALLCLREKVIALHCHIDALRNPARRRQLRRGAPADNDEVGRQRAQGLQIGLEEGPDDFRTVLQSCEFGT